MSNKKNIVLLWLSSSFFLFLMGFEVGGFQALLKAITTTFNLTSIQMGILVGVQYVSIILIPLISGFLSDIKGEKNILLFFVPLFAIGSVLAFLSTTFFILIVGIFLIGSGLSAGECVYSAFLSHISPEDGGAKAINLTQGFLCLGAVGSPLLIRFLSIDWKTFFLICALITIVPIILLIKISQPKKERKAIDFKLFDFSLFKASKIFSIFFIVMIIYVGLENGLGYFSTPLFIEKLNSNSGAFAISAYWLAMALSRFVNSFRNSKINTQLKIRFLSIAIFMVLLSFSNNDVLSVLLYAMLGYAYGPIWSFLMSRASIEIPEKAGTAMGLMSSACGIGGVSFPILMGVLSNYFTIGPSFLFLAMASLSAFLLIKIFVK